MLNRRTLLAFGVAAPWFPVRAATDFGGVSEDEFVLGTSAAFSGPSRGLGIELYRGAMAYFEYVNRAGGIGGRRIRQKIYDDGYQPDPAVTNSTTLMIEDQVFLLFGYVGTPTVTRVLPLLKKFQDRDMYLFFPFTGAAPQREPPYGDFAFNLRASYGQETAVSSTTSWPSAGVASPSSTRRTPTAEAAGAGVRKALTRHGEQIAGEATYKRGTKFTSVMRDQVNILKGANPEAVICIGSYAACAAFARDAVDLGLNVPLANLSFVGSENMLKLLSEGRDDAERYTDLLVNSQVVPSYEDTTIPAVREYRDFMARYNPEVPAELVTEEYTPFPHSFVSLEGFLDAKLLVEILRRLGDNRHARAWSRPCSPSATSTSGSASGCPSARIGGRVCRGCTTPWSTTAVSSRWTTGKGGSPMSAPEPSAGQRGGVGALA